MINDSYFSLQCLLHCCSGTMKQTEVPGCLAERLPLPAGDLSIECVSDMTLQTVRCMITGWNHRRDYHHLQPTEDSTGCARKSQRNIASPTETTPSWSGVKATWRMGWLWPMNICTQRTEFIISICFNTWAGKQNAVKVTVYSMKRNTQCEFDCYCVSFNNGNQKLLGKKGCHECSYSSLARGHTVNWTSALFNSPEFLFKAKHF